MDIDLGLSAESTTGNVNDSSHDTESANLLERTRQFVKKLSHKQWKRLLKKEKRRLIRQKLAKQLAEKEETDLQRIMSDPILKTNEEAKRQLAELKEKQEEDLRKRNHYEWLQREAAAQRQFRMKKEEEERKEDERRKQEQRIKEEWEQQQRREKEAKEKQEKASKAHEDRLNEELKKSGILDEVGEEENWHKPFAPTTTAQANSENYGTEKDKRNCPFFLKTGACRFGERCTRHHVKLTSGKTLLIPSFFLDVRLTEPMLDEHDEDVGLEFDEKELYENFRRFYDDVFPEFAACGSVVQFKICCNNEPHLRGNLYVMYKSEDEALQAYSKFNGRWYAGRQLSVQFSPVTRWKSAICGMFHKKRCPRGKNCNFLHVFRNPGNAFADADRDFYPSPRRSHRSESESSFRSRPEESRQRDHRSSRNYQHEKYHKRRRSSSSSRSPSPHQSDRRSGHRHSRTRERSSRRFTHRSRSRSPSYRYREHREHIRRYKSGNYSARHRRRSKSRSYSPQRDSSRRIKSSLQQEEQRTTSSNVEYPNDTTEHDKKQKAKKLKTEQGKSGSSSSSDSESEALEKAERRRKRKKESRPRLKSKITNGKDKINGQSSNSSSNEDWSDLEDD